MPELKYAITLEEIINGSVKIKPHIDNSKPLTETEIANQLQQEYVNIPFQHWDEMIRKTPTKPKQKQKRIAKCSNLPQYVDINYNNLHWQTFSTNNGTFYLYGAYYDNRTLVGSTAHIRLLGMIDRLQVKVQTHCQLWFEGEFEPVISKVTSYYYMWVKGWGNNKQGLLQPYLMSCAIPSKYNHRVPKSVSLVEQKCGSAKTNLRVIDNKPASKLKDDFAVCVKGLDLIRFDFSVRLVEWIELMNHLGASKIYFYNFGVHANVTKVLNYYEKRGIVHVTPLTLPGVQPNVPELRHLYLRAKTASKRQNELIPYNDCFYKNMNRYKYIALLDIDEIIMPRGKNLYWKDIMDSIKRKDKSNITRASYSFRHDYFFDEYPSVGKPNYADIPLYMHMFQHVQRSVNYTRPGHYVKCFFNTEVVLAVFNHFPFSCLGKCSSFSVDIEDGHLQHYREDCVRSLKGFCGKYKTFTTADTSIWRFKDPIIKRVTLVLYKLNFFPDTLNNYL